MEYNEMDPNIHAPSTSGTSTFRSSDCESDSLLASIFEKEFDRDIAERIAEISEIGDRITECRQYLNRLRKEATIKYYSTLPQDLEPDEQPSIHPAVMNIIGKRPRSTIQTEQFLASNYAEQKRDTRTTRTQLCKKRKSGHLPNVRAKKSAKNDSTVQPQYIPPKIPGNPQENSSVRGNTKMHMRVLIGNVAKQIEQDGNFNPATHKWMVYVRSAPGSLAVDEQVSKVHFFLHPSYKPNDVITIYKPPFTLNRRGWGEFPMRVQLHFKNSSNKPADIIHHLKLNGARSGHHTRSAETYADLWLYPNRRAQGSKLDNSDYILSLASDMLKEEVPDFTSEVICGKCHTTSEGTDSHNCTCSIKDNTFDEGSTAMIADDSSASSSEESDFSEESHSPEETDTADSEDFHAPSTSKAAPKPLPCHTTCNINDPDALQAFLQEEIKRELFDDDIITDSAENCCILCGNIKEENEEITECNCENEHSDANTQEVNKAGTSAINIGSTSEVGMNQLKKMESDILNIEPLDFMDALGIKTEIKEECDVSSLAGSDSKISLFPFELDCSPTSILESEEVKKELQDFLENFTLETNYSEADELIPTNSITHSWPLETYCVSSEKPNVAITMNELDGKTTFVNNNTNHFTNEMSTENNQTKSENVLSTFPNCYTEANVDSNIKMEEVPIDEFINNIVDEEIILDSSNIPVEDVSLGESLQTTNEVPKPQLTLKNMAKSPAALHSQTQAVSQNKQINLNANKQINSFQPQMKAQDNQIILNANKPTNSFQLQVEAQNKQINVNANKPTNSFQSQMKAQDNQIILNANKPTNSFQPQAKAQDNQINVNANKPTNSFQPQAKAQDKQINVNANQPTNSIQPQPRINK
ncbi:uncharacterized protein LOC128993011 [Macrosteles quadrilineatus]|uniref:uncharacterized protein LOC128993011 n=1 Tax=Macrosteles quadrilineatus TaxID=74068 RepID=UPI0023E2C27A|nr:uncharacterized protein LOC128993011 [Macrosteles quadrilineatus]